MVSKDFDRFFAETVRRHRKANQLSQERLAENSDLAPKMISLIERHERNPSVNVAHSVALGLDVPLWRLIKEAEELWRDNQAVK